MHLVQKAGYTQITLDYHRPNIKGRRIFGDLIPYGKIWRTGANAATQIHFDRSVSIGGKSLGPGTFALYTIPGPDKWTWIINQDTSLWGTNGYKQALDIVRVEVPVERLAESIQTLDLRFLNVEYDHLDLAFEWDYTRVRLPISLHTVALAEDKITEVLSDHPTGDDYYQAARYYLEVDKDLDQALSWINKRVELDGEQFGILRYKGLLEYKVGKNQEAKGTIQRSLELAQKAGNEHYVRMNEQTLSDWTKMPMSLSASDLLEKTINYHDPDTLWGRQRLDWRFYEGRPNNSFRLSKMVWTPLEGRFVLTQQVGRNEIYRMVSADTCISKLNGRADLSEAEIAQYGLGCDRNTMYRNYYTYLWGMPMKLHDPGTLIDPRVHERDFFGETLLEIKVTYDPAVGSDIWYFYFDPQTYAMKGYRFYHDEAANDGEYILLDGEVATDGLRIPAKRAWYTHKDHRLLGTDELVGN
jgi:tetratricopeptide (TPR) repeat protein